ncbi:MAG: hypothetical protein L3J65_00980 [Robiginitomaculum sp.]|nr:hypothetical protein [Robiginitomaculum sp.]
MSAIFKLTHEGNDITENIRLHLLSIDLSDERGIQSDNLTINMEDAAGNLALPAAGAEIKFWLGYDDTGLVYKGLFVIDDIETAGPPDNISIKAHAADFTASIQARKETYFENTTIVAIVTFLASEHDLQVSISPRFHNIAIPHISQTNESDMNFLSRLAKTHGAYFAIKNGTMIFAEEAISKSASGKALPVFNIARAETSDFRSTERSRENKFTGAKAAWYDIPGAGKNWELAGEDIRVKALPGTYSDPDTARSAAEAELARLQRGEMTMSITLSRGVPALIPETPVRLTGFKDNLNAVKWVVVTVNHTLGEQGMGTVVDLEQVNKT